MKKIGFLSFGHWTPSPSSQVRSASDALRPVARAGCRCRGGGRRRGVLPRSPLRAAARIAVSAVGGGRRADVENRDRHGRHRHALREPALHGRGRRRRRPHRRWSAAAGHQPRVAGAGDRRLALLRLPAGRGRDRRRHGAPPHRGVPGGAERGGVRPTEPAADVPQPAGPAHGRAAFAGVARPDLVGRRIGQDRSLGGQPWA